MSITVIVHLNNATTISAYLHHRHIYFVCFAHVAILFIYAVITFIILQKSVVLIPLNVCFQSLSDFMLVKHVSDVVFHQRLQSLLLLSFIFCLSNFSPLGSHSSVNLSRQSTQDYRYVGTLVSVVSCLCHNWFMSPQVYVTTGLYCHMVYVNEGTIMEIG